MAAATKGPTGSGGNTNAGTSSLRGPAASLAAAKKLSQSSPQQSQQATQASKTRSIQAMINSGTIANPVTFSGAADQGIYGRFSTGPNWQTASGASDFSSTNARKGMSPGGWMGMTKNADGGFSSSFSNKYGNPVVNWSGSFAANPDFRSLRTDAENGLVGRGLTEKGNKLYRALEDTSLRIGQPITVFSAGRLGGGLNHKYGYAVDTFLRDPVTNIPVGEQALRDKGPGLAKWASFPIGGVSEKMGRPPSVAAKIHSVLSDPYKQWSNAVYDTVYQNPSAYSGVARGLRYGGDFKTGSTARDYMHHDVTPGKGLQAGNHKGAATRAVAGSFVDASQLGAVPAGFTGATEPQQASPTTQVVQNYIPRPNPRPPVQTVQGQGVVKPGFMPAVSPPPKQITDRVYPEVAVNPGPITPKGVRIMKGITPGPFPPGSVSTPFKDQSRVPPTITPGITPGPMPPQGIYPGKIQPGPMPPAGFTPPEVAQGPLPPPMGITPGPMPPQGYPRPPEIVQRPLPPPPMGITPGITPGPMPPQGYPRPPESPQIATGPLKPPPGYIGVIPGPMPSGSYPVMAGDPDGITTSPLGPPPGYRGIIPGPVPPGSYPSVNVASVDAPVEEGDAAGDSAPPFRNYAHPKMPKEYKDRYFPSAPSLAEEQIASENPVQGPSNPSQEPEDPRAVRQRQEKHANTGAAIGGLVAGPIGTIIGGLLGWQMGKTSPNLRQQIANNPDAVRQNVASINQMVNQHLPQNGSREAGSSMYVTEAGFRDVMAQPDKVTAEPEKYTTLEQMLAALAKGINPYSGSTI